MQAYQTPSVVLLQRPARLEDEHFLFALFAAEKRAEFAAFGVPATEAEMLVEMQYRGRKLTYSAQHPDAKDSILLAEDGTPAGRLLVDRKPGRWRVIDIAVLPEYRGRGLGTRALEVIQVRCAMADAKLELQVGSTNQARRFYERLGFRVTSEDALAVQMLWSGAGLGRRSECGD